MKDGDQETGILIAVLHSNGTAQFVLGILVRDMLRGIDIAIADSGGQRD